MRPAEIADPAPEMQRRPAVLELKNIYKQFDGKPVLTDVTLAVPRGETRALIGTSGSGKTTLLRITLGLISPDAGSVRIGNRELMSFSPTGWAERVGYVPQEGGLFPHLTARQNVELVAKLRKSGVSQREARLKELCALVGLNLVDLVRYPHGLSGGQRQRVAIMRAAFMDPPVLLLDEPMGSLDPLVRRDLQHELKLIFRKLGKTVLIVTHDLGEAAFLADKITLLHQGRVVQTGEYRDLLHHPADPFVSLFISANRAFPEAEAA